MQLESRIQNYWQGEASGYSNSIQEELSDEKRQAWRNLILGYLPVDKHLKILDIGTGPGFFPIILGEAGHDVTGIDLTENMLACAKKNAEQEGVTATFLQMNAQHLTFEEESFDLVVCRNLTWILEEPEQAYEEWKRVLKTGGRLLIFDANWNHYQFDETVRKRHEEIERQTIEQFGEASHAHADLQESEAISELLPMGHYQRPVWDLQLFAKLGFREVFALLDISDRIPFSQRELFEYQDTPQFLVGAEK